MTTTNTQSKTVPNGTEVDKKVQRAISKLYAMKSFKAVSDKLIKVGLITTAEHTELKKLSHKMTEKYMDEN